MNDHFLEFLDQLSTAADPQEIQTKTSSFLASLGFDRFTYVGFNPPGPNPHAGVMSTFCKEWVKHYVDNDYVYIDPTVLVGKRSSASFTWDQVDLLEGLSREQKQINSEAKEFGMRHVVSVPIHGPMNDFAIFVASSAMSDKEFARNIRHRQHELHLVGINLHSAFHDRFLRPFAPDFVKLSPRETECLLWTARGKTAWEVGEILGISERTVNDYISTAARKFDCTQKTLAVTRAIIGGYISP